MRWRFAEQFVHGHHVTQLRSASQASTAGHKQQVKGECLQQCAAALVTILAVASHLLVAVSWAFWRPSGGTGTAGQRIQSCACAQLDSS